MQLLEQTLPTLAANLAVDEALLLEAEKQWGRDSSPVGVAFSSRGPRFGV